MANHTTVKAQDIKPQLTTNTEAKTLLVGDLISATHAADGLITVKETLGTLKLVDVADVDLLLTFANGDHVIIANGALDALSPNPPDAIFNDQKINLSELFKLVGVANPAKSGSLRLVSENIDANPPREDIATNSDKSVEFAPPAPIVKVGVGTSSGPGKGPGNGGGEGEGDVPATVVPIATAQPAVYRVGRTTQSIQDLLNGTGLGQPNISTALYTSSEYKVTPSGRSDLPLGAYDASASTDQLVERASPAGQSSREVINGTVGNDTIDFNAAFSASVGQWAKNLHITLNNFSEVNSIQLVFNAAKIAQIPGFDLQGVGVTRDSPTSNSWHVTPDAAMLLNGLDVAIVYNVNDSAAPVDFGADVIVDGKAGPFAFQVVNNLNLTWRDAVTQTDFTVLSSTGDPLMVLPRAGVGVEVFAGTGNDTINAGAGPDLIHGGDGDDSINAGTGNDVLDGGLGSDILDGGQGSDTASYYNATTAVTASLDTGLGVINAGEATGDLYVNIENLTGSDFDDILIGDAQKNTLIGGTGSDKLAGRGNGDILDGGDGNDTASYEYAVSAVTVSLASNTGTQGEADGDELISIENLIGGAGNDTFISGLGVQANAYDGRTGIDTVSYVASTTGIAATLTAGLIPQTNDAAGDTFTSIENLVGSNQDDTLIGNSANNSLNGGLGNDLLEGMFGSDNLIGAGGNDTASYEHAALGVVASLTTVFTVGPVVIQMNDAFGDTFSAIENLKGSNLNDNLIGDNLANLLTGGDGDDVLEGMAGSDVLLGGNGSDTASYEHAVTGVAVSLTNGLSGFSSAGDAAGDTFNSIENITGSNYNDTLIGDVNNNILIGGDGDDLFEGMAGADTLTGGLGNNTASYSRSADLGGGLGVTASLLNSGVNTGDATGDSYSFIQNLVGTAFDDTLVGDANNNTLTGGSGNDSLNGGVGVDLLYGGDGNDNLTDEGTGAYILDGGAGNDVVTLTNTDTITGSVTGGAGTDTLVWDYATGGQRIDINMQSGSIHYYLNNGTRTLFSGIENVTATGTNSFYVYADNNANVITGGTGNDWVDYRYAIAGVNANIDTVVHTINGVTVNAQSATGGSGNDTLIGIDNLYAGSQYNDILFGNSGDNWIRGYTGNDVIDGGAGVDTWYIDWNGNSVTASLLTAMQNTAMGIVMTGDAAGDTIDNMENIYSNNGDSLFGNAQANDLYGRGLLEGFNGADNLRASATTAIASYANAGNSYLVGQGISTAIINNVGVTASLTTSFSVGPAIFNTGDAAGDTYVGINNLTGSTFNDTLIGNSVANTIDGGSGDDSLEGLAGGDTFRGGTGQDAVSYAHSTAGIVASLFAPGTNTNDAAGDNYSSIENLTGSNFNDTLRGDGNDNLLDGGLGTNTLDGSGGFDTASYLTATAAVNIDLAAGTVTGAGRTDTLVSIERVIGSIYADTIVGTAGNDWIDGGIDSTSGADNIDAAGGNDTISYLNATGGRTVVLNTSSSDGKVLSNFENIYGSNSGDDLTGDANNNIIEGALGNDILNGAAGVDTVSYALSAAAVSVNISGATVAGITANVATGGEGNDTLSNFENITGSAFNDILVGDGNANTITGGDGDDLIVGGAGADNLLGGNGIDTLSYTNALAAVTITLNGVGTAGDANGDVTSGFENLVGSAVNDVLTGDATNNVIDGGAGNDTINANGGVDTITYLAAISAVTVNLGNAGVNATGGAGSDTLTNFENIIGSSFADNLTGDGGTNIIEGGLGNDVIDGAAGVDTLSYENASGAVSANISGAVVLSQAANSASGSAGNDTISNMENIIGSAFNDILIGNNLVNAIDGGVGDDTLVGGAGADNLIGGAGIDMASYVNAASAVRATLGGAALTHLGDALGDTFTGIENLTGSAFADTLYGDSSNNSIIGGAGNDDLRGYDGNDTINATQGLDQIYGGNGDDTILVNATSVGAAAQYRGEGNNSTAFGGGDTIKLSGLVAGGYNLTPLANETDSMEMLDIRDGVSTSLSATSLDIRNFVDGGNGSNIWIKADAAGDSFQLIPVAGETLQQFNVANGIDYVVFDATNTQVAAIHWQTA